MRTTLNIDDDVLAAARERARRERRTAGAVISELARQSLVAPRPGEDGGRTVGDAIVPPSRNGFSPLPHRGRLVSNALIDELRESEPE